MSRSWCQGYRATDLAGDRGLGRSNRSLGGLRSLVWLEQGRAVIQASGGPGPWIWGWIVIAVPRDERRDLDSWKRSGSGTSSGLGTREPTGPGTATVARRAMSATLATTS